MSLTDIIEEPTTRLIAEELFLAGLSPTADELRAALRRSSHAHAPGDYLLPPEAAAEDVLREVALIRKCRP